MQSVRSLLSGGFLLAMAAVALAVGGAINEGTYTMTPTSPSPPPPATTGTGGTTGGTFTWGGIEYVLDGGPPIHYRSSAGYTVTFDPGGASGTYTYKDAQGNTLQSGSYQKK